MGAIVTMLVYSYSRLFLLTMAVITMVKIYVIIRVRQEIHRRMPVSTSYSSFAVAYLKNFLQLEVTLFYSLLR